MNQDLQDTYLTIAEPSQGMYKEKGSKFLAFAYPVSHEESIKNHIQDLKKTYFDARHHCYAYILGYKQDRYRANDDGEPGNSAGNPILGQIRSRNLTDVLIVVVRYFGGTKLGVSGLIQAYKTASAEALNNSQIVECQALDHIHIQFNYPQMNDVMKIIKTYDLDIVSQKTELHCEMNIRVRKKLNPEVTKKLHEIEGLVLTQIF
ncbi:MAG: YigZ family protein [Microscillaceae bacterium]|nr:YigZ family protein [Microscillaceae bacterium]